MTNPVPGQEEMCYFLQYNEPQVSLINQNLGRAFTLQWTKNTLPCFVQWKSMVSGDYALGLEPCTSELDEGFAYRPVQPGEKIIMRLTLSVNEL